MLNLYILRTQNHFSMKTLTQLIHSMTKEEQRVFKLISNRTKTQDLRKDLLLFNYYKNHTIDTDDNYISKKLYDNNKNAFYQLKNRLLNDIINTLTFQKLNNDNDISVFKLIIIGKSLREKGLFDLSFEFLKNAEKKALKFELYEILNLIYNEIIKLSYDNNDIDVLEFLKKRKVNNHHVNQLKEIDDVLAAVNFRLKKTQNYQSTTPKIISILEDTIKEYSDNPAILKSDKLKLKIVQSTSKLLLQKRNYKDLEVFLKHSLADLEKDHVFNKKNHHIKLQTLTYLINCLFKNKKYQESIEKTHLLRKAMDEYDGYLRNKYMFYYYNGLVINYSILDNQKAIDILLTAKSDTSIQNSDYHYFFICSNLALQYFDNKQYKPSIKILSRIILHQNFLTFDVSFQIKILAAELIIRYEIGNYDILEMRIKKIRSRLKDLLSNRSYAREHLLIKVISKLIYTQRIDLNKSLMDDIHTLLSIATTEQANETDIINYNKWIENKISQ